ncbi:hypothetical protein ABTJ77_19485, partial [Acinetobacter baumannii]
RAADDLGEARMEPSTSKRDSRPIHHSPVFWIGIVMCLAAIAIYLWSDDLSRTLLWSRSG